MKKSCFFISFIIVVFFSFSSLQGSDETEWIFETGGRIVATPVIRNDTLFIGSLDGNFYLIDITTGTEIWHFTTGNEIRTTAALYNNILCFESGNVLYGLNMAGDLLWSEILYSGDLINENDSWDCFRSSPTLLDSIAYIGSEEGLVLGVNVKTGEKVYEAQTSQADVTIETTPAIYNNKVFVGDWYGVFSVFDLSTQELVWQYDTKNDNTYSWVNAIVSKPLIYNDTLYFGGRNCNLYAFNPETGERHWKFHEPNDKWLFGGPVVSDDVLYVGTSFQQLLYAFNPNEPEILWSTNVYGLNYGDPVIHGDYILIGTGVTTDVKNSGSLTIVNKQTHEIMERYPVNGWVETPLYLDGIIYFGCADGKVYAINEQELLNTLRPHTFLKDESIIDFGQLPNSGSIDTSFYMYNDGEGVDSLVLNSSYDYVTIEPTTFLLPASDSAEISVNIDLSGLSSGIKNVNIRYRSLNAMLPQTIVTKNIRFEITGTTSLNQSEQSMSTFIGQNYPNPATGITQFDYYLEKECFIQLTLRDILGNTLMNLINETRPQGQHTFLFDTTTIKNGTYLYTFRAGEKYISREMTIIN